MICVADIYNDVYEVETTVPISIPFDNASVEINIYRADRREFNDNPWETLSFLASDILEKLHLGEVYFNKKELELLPLLNELSALSLFSNLYERECTDFVILKQYIKKYNLNHLIPLLIKVERAYKNKSCTYLVLSKLYNKLNESICESLWRELYELVSESQQEYEDKILFFDQDKLNVIRLQIEDYFHELGYEGSFPNFIKSGSIKGIRLEVSYNQTYFLGLEKNVKSVISCREIFFGDTLFIQFICGTALLKKDEDIIDIYSCCFNKKGRRLFKRINWNTDDIDVLNQFIIIAGKRAECKKITKEEKELLGISNFSLKYFLLMFIFTGALFSVLMTVGVFLLLCLITALLDGFDGILDMIKIMPWWLFLTISFVGFGGGMAFADKKANSK